MSATALKYPSKPAETADDLEAFVYVVLWLAYQFHKHSLSPKAPSSATKEEQRSANKRNGALARKIDAFFYEESPRANGLCVGGDAKLSSIHRNTPPIEMWNSNSAIGAFLDGAYKILNEHYRAIDFSQLQPYYLPPPEWLKDGSTPAKKIGGRAGVNPIRQRWGNAAPEGPIPQAHAPATVPTAPDARRLLDDHRSLEVLLDAVLEGIIAGTLDDNDYLFDQFKALSEFTESAPKNSTGQRDHATSSSSRGTKRSSAESNGAGAAGDESASTRRPKRAKRSQRRKSEDEVETALAEPSPSL